jgi:hypothetical protein
MRKLCHDRLDREEDREAGSRQDERDPRSEIRDLEVTSQMRTLQLSKKRTFPTDHSNGRERN